MPTQDRTISHAGSTLTEGGSQNAVTLDSNQVTPEQRETEIATFECPENFDAISFVASRDPVRFQPRTVVEVSGSADGSTSTFSVPQNLQPVNGEKEIDEQQYAVVEAAVNGSFVEVESVDYATGDVTLASDPGSSDEVYLFPIVSTGTIKMFGENTLGQNTKPMFPYGFPLYRFHDMKQNKRGQEIHLAGAITWKRNESLVIVADSPHPIRWEHTEYPGAFVSELELDVQITF
jgi:hypothetical protein